MAASFGHFLFQTIFRINSFELCHIPCFAGDIGDLSQAAKEEAEREAAEMKAQPNVAPMVKK